MGIGLMTRLLVSEYRMQILLEVLEYRGHRVYDSPASFGVLDVDFVGVQGGLGVPPGYRAYDSSVSIGVPSVDLAGIERVLGVLLGHRAYEHHI